MTEYFKSGVSYGLVNLERSALSNIIKPVCNVHFVKLPLVCRLLQGFFNIMSALPRYVTSSEVTKVFTFIKSKAALTDYALKTISHRLAMILYLTTGQRSMFV